MKYNYQGKTVTIVGLGKTGLSCVEFFKQKQAVIQVMDTRLQPSGLDQLSSNIAVYTGGLSLDWLLASDLIVVSPGIALSTPEIAQAIEAGIEVVGDIELFCREITTPIVAITGSNGKSTVTTLVYQMAQEAGLQVGLGGNIGIPALSLLQQSYDLIVLELSSFQLETTFSLNAAAATVLNISEDHMNRYRDLEDYRQAKLKIYQGAKVAVVNADDPLTDWRNSSVLIGDDTKKVSFATQNADYHCIIRSVSGNPKSSHSYLAHQNQIVIDCEQMKLSGGHNYLNALAALALADAVNIPRQASIAILKHFSGLAHRFQTVYQADGVRWINDSKATNVGSTQAALAGLTFTGKLHLLLGGDGKGADFSPLQPLLKQENIFCYCFGQDGKKLAQLTKQSEYFTTMAEAIAALRPKLQAGDIVLLSPACASLDQFPNFEVRGEEFKRLAEMSITVK